MSEVTVETVSAELEAAKAELAALKEAAKKGSGVKLTCNVCDKTRPSNKTYLADKRSKLSEKLGKEVSLEEFEANYCCKSCAGALRKGKHISDLTEKKISDEELTRYLAYNGKAKVTYTVKDGRATGHASDEPKTAEEARAKIAELEAKLKKMETVEMDLG